MLTFISYSELPFSRVTESHPFSRVRTYYVGPLLIKENQLRKTRHYVHEVIFVCFMIRAVHLELGSNVSTSAFIAV